MGESINIIKKGTDSVFYADKEVSLEINTEKSE